MPKVFTMDRLWAKLRQESGPELRAALADAQEMGEPDLLPFETLTYTYGKIGEAYGSILEFFNIDPASVPGLVAIRDAEEHEDIDEDIFEDLIRDFSEEYLVPMYQRVTKAFDTLKPADIPGFVVVGDYYDQVVLGYYEEPSEEERENYEKVLEEAEQERLKRAEYLKDQLLQRTKGWKLPTKRKMGEWIAKNFELKELWATIKKKRATKKFQRALEKDGEADFMIEEASQEGDPNFEIVLGAYLEVPVYVMKAYTDMNLDVWDEVLEPMTHIFDEAMEKKVPESIPGSVELGWDFDQQAFGIMYKEVDVGGDDEDDEEEEEEEEEEGEEE
jgi:hypothetical protein